MEPDYSIAVSSTDGVEIMNSVMFRPSVDVPLPHEWWDRRIATLCEALAERNLQHKVQLNNARTAMDTVKLREEELATLRDERRDL